MTIESASYVSQLNSAYPAVGDPKSEGDDHLRLIKSAVVATFPNVAGAVTATHTTLNTIGVTQPTTDVSTAVASTAHVTAKILAATMTPAQGVGNVTYLSAAYGAL